MKVGVKQFNVEMELKTKGMELEVRDNDGNFRGDFVVTKKGVIWCKGKERRASGVNLDWDKFIELMEGQRNGKPK